MVSRIPAAHALHLADVAELFGVPRSRLFRAWGIDEDSLSDPDRSLDLRTLRRLVAVTRRLSGEQAIGLLLGTRMQIANHGNLGFAVMTAPTAGDGLRVAIRYAPIRTDALSLRLEEDPEAERAHLIIEEHADFGDARDVVMVALVVGIWRIGQAVTGKTLHGDVDFAFEAPAYAARFAALAPGVVRFGQPHNRLSFHRRVLGWPFVMSDPATHRRACDHCEQELAQHAETSAVGQVRRALGATPPPDLAQVAKTLAVSPRTLKRRLADEDTSFRAVRDEVLEARARALLREGLGLDEIAAQLGYHDAAGFSRAFRRWTGTSPGRAR